MVKATHTNNRGITFRCPVCADERFSEFWEICDIPIKCNVLCSTREQALSVPRADIHLAICRSCGYICNTAFNPELMQYNQTYENALHFSPHFREYAEGLAQWLIHRYDLYAKDILEIACGDGYFLRLLCKENSNRGLGFDPSYRTTTEDKTNGSNIRIIQDYFSHKYSKQAADLICCRHALEHIPDPVAFLQMVRETIGDSSDTVVFFEVPNTMFILRDLSVWDIIYEHCCYFTLPSLIQAFKAGGFEVDDIREVYHGQFITIAARPVAKNVKTTPADDRSVSQVVGATQTFANHFSNKLETWKKRFMSFVANDRKIVLWGAGSKGVTLLNMLRAFCDVSRIQYVVDINHRKHGKFIAGTGQEIVPPEILKKYRPDVVVIMNSVYTDEIRTQLQAMNLSVEIIEA